MNKRKQQAIQTKQKLLDAADALVKEKGFDAVSVDDIVAACGVAKGTFYHYFESKADLLVYLTRTPYEDLKQKFAASAGKPYLERMQLFMHDWFHMVEKYNIHFSMLHNRLATLEGGSLKQFEKQSQIDEGLTILRYCLNGAVVSGELTGKTPVDSIAMALIFSMQGTTLYQVQNADIFDVGEWAEKFISLVFDSILKPFLPSQTE